MPTECGLFAECQTGDLVPRSSDSVIEIQVLGMLILTRFNDALIQIRIKIPPQPSTHY